MALEKEVPYCTIFLVAGTIACHLMVLIGNLSTATMLHGFGHSTSGWANVGTSLSTAMHKELEPDMDKVASFLSDTIGKVSQIESGIDIVLSDSGSRLDAALAAKTFENITKVDLGDYRDKLLAKLKPHVEKLLDRVHEIVVQFIDIISPALNKMREWLHSFGEKIQGALEEFGTTIDRVQKLFDQVMAKLSPTAGSNEDDMLLNTYALINTNNDATVDAADLRSVARLYGISALAGSKADDLFKEYDADGKGGLDKDEYALFVHDPSIPGIMTLMLRTYAKQLSTAAGRVAGAKMRDEIARAVGDYVALVCAKNMTRLSWIAQALSNGSLPISFNADLLTVLALDVDNPGKLTRADAGGSLTSDMMRMNATHVVEALKLMSDPAFWDAEGFDADEQPPAVQQVVRWILAAPNGTDVLRSGLGFEPDDARAAEEKLPEAAFQVTLRRSSDYMAKKGTEKTAASSSLYKSQASQRLRDLLLGGLGAAAAGDNPDADATQRQGVRATHATLEFASWLSNNATDVADGYQHDCWDYSGESSGTLESFANEVNGIVKKVQTFMGLMSKYSTEKGFDQLISEARGFAGDASKDIMLVVDHYATERLHFIECKLNLTNCTSKEKSEDMPVVLSGAFTFLTTTLQELKSVLPVVIDNVKFAKSEVSKVHAGMRSVMQTLQGKAPPMFYQISSLYKTLWVSYFVFFGLLTIGMLFYGFWASGWFGGPSLATAEESFEPPHTVTDKVRVCWRSCNACMRDCHDSHLSFWSVLLLMEAVVLVLFVVAVVICIVGGIQAFMSAGCSQVYVLADRTICTVALKTMQTFLKTFWADRASADINETCVGESLLTCRLIAEQMVSAVKLSMFGGLVASVLSLQLLVDSAVKHEQVSFRRLLNAEAKEAKEA
mmetsp:Transcript_85439/g.226922  ORF Transcript_85439/g.226922 Transcript_85439/m.226922 type:complete len:896 (-) Transcript_85439:26-2713(-)|eukprot:CAMPEP_0171165418 /NCGR_PEP_ID=MMETSP0790-20130122/6174_1 /TAXON_ID=2925 /ORGANISM="Alexandrium catenella, Strain OF101" /LENGTH=895 /DNA_ID=CAMNT_0011630205 /DNA_START=22 /DNA_END=2709 /DNA_ORIENTATION=-